MKQFFKNHNVNPYKSLLMPLLQIPILMSFFFALRKMLDVPIPSMTNGGTLWFTDLSLMDPTYTLPVLAGISTLSAFEITLRSNPAPLLEKFANPFRAMICLSIGLTRYVYTLNRNHNNYIYYHKYKSILWFKELSLMNSTYSLPILACLSSLKAFEITLKSNRAD